MVKQFQKNVRGQIMSDCIGNEKHCKCMDCSHNRAEEKYNRLLDNEEYYEDWGWGWN